MTNKEQLVDCVEKINKVRLKLKEQLEKLDNAKDTLIFLEEKGESPIGSSPS